MRNRSTTALAALLGSLSAGAAAEAATPLPVTEVRNGGTQTVVYAIETGGQRLVGASITLSIYGDFDTSEEFVKVDLNGYSLGAVLNNDSSDDAFNFVDDDGDKCLSTRTATAVVGESIIEKLPEAGPLKLTLTKPASVGAFCPEAPGGEPSTIAMRVSGAFSYTTAGPDTSTDTTDGSDAPDGLGGSIYTNAASTLANNRASVTLASMPALSGRLSGGGGTSISGSGVGAAGHFGLSGDLSSLRQALSMSDQSLGAFDAAEAPAPLDVWFGGSFSYFEYDAEGLEQQGEVGALQAGVDTRLSDDLLIGVAVFADLLSSETSDDVDTSSIGFLAGPYAVVSIDENVYLEGLVAVGTAFNTIETEGFSDSDYQSDRLLLSARASGEWRVDHWTFRPSTRVIYYAERQEAFTSGDGSEVAESTVTLGQLRFGPEVAYELAFDDVIARPFVGVEGVWAFSESDQSVNGVQVATEDLTAGAAIGFDAAIGRTTVRAGARYEGIGADYLDSVTGEVTVRIPLQ